jgi:hypothetical protein
VVARHFVRHRLASPLTMWIGCYDWSARKILWVAWTWNALVQTIWSLLAVVQGQKINKLHDTFEANDRTSANLVTGIVATSAWAVVLIGLFLIFSLVVLLKKVRMSRITRSEPPVCASGAARATDAKNTENRRRTTPGQNVGADWQTDTIRTPHQTRDQKNKNLLRLYSRVDVALRPSLRRARASPTV